jgi:RHS repeat-associated protein
MAQRNQSDMTQALSRFSDDSGRRGKTTFLPRRRWARAGRPSGPARRRIQAVTTNAAGQATDELAGNGFHTLSNFDSITGRLNARTTGASSQIQNLSYLWDKAGNLTQRRDVASNLTEAFIYDNLYRVTSSTLNSVNNLTVSYAANGNILTKTGLTGTYNYTTAQTGCTYTGQALQPHAVRNAGGVVYCYDKNGNMTLRGGQATTWFSYNLPNQIRKTATTHATFSYGASRARYKQVSVTASGQSMPAGTETTIYIGSLFEKVTKPSAVTEYKHTILAGGEAIAIKTLRSNSINDVRYLHKDHLGSVDAVTTDTATLVSRFSFDAFGKRRAAGTWTGTPTAAEWTTAAGVTHRGFTYHEQLDNVDLVHMNGRVYDPNIGRFLSADPIVQAPLMSQSLNRYSYVMNNPLSLVDPSGFSWLSKLFRKVLPQLLRIVINYFVPGLGEAFYHAYQIASNIYNVYNTLSSLANRNGGPAGAGPSAGSGVGIRLAAAGGPGPAQQLTFAGDDGGGARTDSCSLEDGVGCEPSNPTWDTYARNESIGLEVSTDAQGTTWIRGTITVSGYDAVNAARSISNIWGNVKGKYDGKRYRAQIRAVPAAGGGMITIGKLSDADTLSRQQAMLKAALACDSTLNPADIDVRKIGVAYVLSTEANTIWIGYSQSDSTYAHEFGHSIGLRHAPSESGSIMGYGRSKDGMYRSVKPRDLYNLATLYGK